MTIKQNSDNALSTVPTLLHVLEQRDDIFYDCFRGMAALLTLADLLEVSAFIFLEIEDVQHFEHSR